MTWELVWQFALMIVSGVIGGLIGGFLWCLIYFGPREVREVLFGPKN